MAHAHHVHHSGSGHSGSGHSGDSGSIGRGLGDLIDWPHRYDLSVTALLFGRGRALRRQFADLVDLRAGQHVLDVGSGTGTLALALAHVTGPSGSATGVDPAAAMVQAARAKARGRAAVRFLVAPAQALPFADGSFNAVLSSLVLHHVPADVRATALAEMLRVLRPGGHLLIGDLQPPSGWRDRLVARSQFRHPVTAAHLDELERHLIAAGAIDVHRHASAAGWLGLLHARHSSTA